MLGIEDASVVEVVLDLKERQKKGFSSIEDIIPVYEYLQSLCVNSYVTFPALTCYSSTH